MSEKTLKSRIIHKHDIEANWKLATNFSPRAGEFIIYDPDENNPHSRVKIGDGKTNVNDLPFIESSRADKATEADHATQADTATNANHAVSADTATNADTVGGKSATDFALAADLDVLEGLVGDTAVSTQISEAIANIDTEVSWNDLTDKPFGEKEVGSNILIWDCDTTGKESPDGMMYFVCDAEVTYEELKKSAVVEIYSDGSQIFSFDFITQINDSDVIITEAFAYAKFDGAKLGDVTYPKRGFYCYPNGDEFRIILDESVKVFKTIEVVPIDTEYLPDVVSDWNQTDETALNYIKNRPFYEEITEVILVDNETLSFALNMGNQIAAGKNNMPELIEGQTYTVIWDGDTYTCVAYTPTNSHSIALGNGMICNYDDGTNCNDEPFFIYKSEYNSYWNMITQTTGQHTITVSTVENVIHTFDAKFLPISMKAGEGEGSIICGSLEVNEASGRVSFASGGGTIASGECSHAEGSGTEALGASSHAEGRSTAANGSASHAEGQATDADGWCSHSEGNGTRAVGWAQHVQGTYNIIDTTVNSSVKGTYAHIVGNGPDSSKRSNAHTLDWDGNAWFQGEVKIGGTGQDDATAKTLATTEDVNSAVTNKADKEHNHDDRYYTEAEVNTKFSTMVGDAPVAIQISDAIDAIPQADWNQNDETAADYVLNKTHYEYVEYSDTLVWDGNTEGLESDASGTLFLVSDITPTIEDFQNGHVIKIDAENEEWVVDSVIEDNGTITDDTGFFFVVYEDNTTIEWTSFPKKGIYFSGTAQNPMARLAAPTVEYLRINGYNGFPTTTLKQLDEKFIPDTIARTANHYTKTEIDEYELITIADIDEICNGVTEGSLAQSDVDELMAQIQ